MNKQELIKFIGKLPFSNGPIADTVTVNREWILNSIERLDEPQKVTVPQFVADYIKDTKYYEWDLDDVFDNIAEESGESEISKWFYTLGNIDVFARAWLDGYEVAKEKRYLVKMKGITTSPSYLKCNTKSGNWFLSGYEEAFPYRAKHTRKELEEAGFGDVFDSSLFEVEEVEHE